MKTLSVLNSRAIARTVSTRSAQRAGDVDMIDPIAEIGDKSHLLARFGDHRRIDRVGDGRYENIGFAHRLDDLGLRHWVVFEVEASVEQFGHAGFDEVGQPPGHHHRGFFLVMSAALLPGGAIAAAPTSTIRVPASTSLRLVYDGRRKCLREAPPTGFGPSGWRPLAEERAKQGWPLRRRGSRYGTNRRPISVLGFARRGVLTMLSALVLAPGLAAADPIGSVTKLPLPQFASLKTDRVNLREGPSKDHATKWVYQRAGLPVEITAEFEYGDGSAILRASKGGFSIRCFPADEPRWLRQTKRARTQRSTRARPIQRNWPPRSSRG